MTSNCLLCEKVATEDQDCTTLVCSAHGTTNCHTSTVHDKCWEKFKKQFVRGRAGSRSATVFFCPVAGCHNALDGQHTAARKVEAKVSRKLKEEDADDEDEKHQMTAAERRKREEALGLVEEVDDLEGRCIEIRNDGTPCGRVIFDEELGCCKLHMEHCRKKRILEMQLAEDSEAKRALAEANRLANKEEEDLLARAERRPKRETGINMEIAEKAPSLPAPPPSVESRDASYAAGSNITAAPVKVAAWAAAHGGINQQKAKAAALDTSKYIHMRTPSLLTSLGHDRIQSYICAPPPSRLPCATLPVADRRVCHVSGTSTRSC